MMEKVLNKFLVLVPLLLISNIVLAADCDFANKKTISLVDSTFCSNNLVTQLSKAKLDEYRDEYKKYFGDVTITRVDTETTVGWTPAKIAPTESSVGHCNAPNQLPITTLTCEIATEKWTGLMEVLKKICDGVPNKKPEEMKLSSDTYLEELEGLAKKYNSLSIPEIKFTEYNAQAFLKLYRTFTNELKCDDFGTANKFDEKWELYGKEEGSLSEEQRDSFDYSNYYFVYVTNIAYHQSLSLMYNYANLVKTAISTMNEEQRKSYEVLLTGLNESSGGKLEDIQATQMQIAKGIFDLNQAVENRVKNYKQPGYKK